VSTASAYRYDSSVLREVFEHRFTYVAGIERNSHRFARSPALRDPASGRGWTYAELWRDAGRLADALRSHGVAPGESVVFALFNGPEFALLWVACLRLGAIATPINFRLSAGEIAHVLDDSRPSAFVFDETLQRTAADALTRAEHQPSLLAAVGEATAPAWAFDELLASGDPAAEVRPGGRAQIPTIYDETTRLYTSGTTGMPKGVSLCSLTETLSAHDVIMHFPLEPQDRTLNMTPWFHRGGLYSGGPNPVFYLGAESIALRQFDPATVLDWVQEHGLTFLIGAPTNLAMLTAEQQRSPRDLGTLKGIVTMGAPLDREACLRYQQTLTARIFNGYGTTEAFWNTFLRPSDLPDHAGSAGRACTDDDVAVVRIYEDRLADPSDTVARDGTEVGEVAVRSVKSGYAYVNNATEQDERFRDGWLYIGDLATWDADEYVTIVGRKDDMIISGGENVHPTQVEAVLTEHPGVTDAAVVGLPDDRWGEIVVAYVIASDPALDAATLEAHSSGHPMLAAYKRPRLYRFVPELPMTATGKKVHYQVREMATRDAAAGLLQRP
jgi:acyl-CoA synthetase (AMP-forming)/AMP-acid ligase II